MTCIYTTRKCIKSCTSVSGPIKFPYKLASFPDHFQILSCSYGDNLEQSACIRVEDQKQKYNFDWPNCSYTCNNIKI